MEKDQIQWLNCKKLTPPKIDKILFQQTFFKVVLD